MLGENFGELSENDALSVRLQSLLESIRSTEVLLEFLDTENREIIQEGLDIMKEEVVKILGNSTENISINDFKEDDEPDWMAEIRILQKIGKIPEYRGKIKDGDAYEWYQNYFGPWLDVMNQKNLMTLMGRKILDGIKLSAVEMGVNRNTLIRPSTEKKS